MSSTISAVPASDDPGYVHVGGRRLYLECAGQGSPTVILEAGAGRAHDTWDAVWSALTTLTRVCRYDRAGIGQSERGPRPRTVQDVVTDLHALLRAAPVSGPYLLVGHSLGGLIVRLYAGLHPEEVVGLVLLDSSHPDQLDRERTVFLTRRSGESESVQAFRAESLNPNPARHIEGIDLQASVAQVRVAPIPTGLPIVVVSRGKPSDWPDDFPADLVADLEHVWRGLQSDLLQLSRDAKHLIATQSSHFIQFDEPQLVVEAIRSAIAAARR